MDSETPLGGLYTVFVIVYLQELAWIFTPLIVTLNVLIHANLSELDHFTRWASIVSFGFFAFTGASIALSLVLIQKRALPLQRFFYVCPYMLLKALRTTTLLIVCGIILQRANLRVRYFHIAVYGIVESLSNVVAMEICFRSRAIFRLARRRKLGRAEDCSNLHTNHAPPFDQHHLIANI